MPTPSISASVINVYEDARAWRGQWDFRLTRSSLTQLTLQQIGPNSVAGASVVQDLGTLYPNSMETMDAAALATGTAISTTTDTLLAVYWCLDGDFAGGLGFSSTLPTLDVDGQRKLGIAGAASNCYFIGAVYTDSAGQYQDNESQRHVANWFNARALRIFLCPNANDANNESTYVIPASAVWQSAVGLGGPAVSFVTLGDCAVDLGLNVVLGATNADIFQVGLSLDGGSSLLCSSSISNLGRTGHGVSCRASSELAIGRYTAEFWAFNNNLVGGTTVLADSARNGLTRDPPKTYIEGWVWA